MGPSPGQAHLWLTDPQSIRDGALLRAYDELLSDDERLANQRFVFDKDRRTHLVTRALVRTTLSRYAPIAPVDWQFETNEYGRPAIARAHAHGDLVFNLSHTAGLIACAVARACEIGVDVEAVNKKRATLEIAESVFAPEELRQLQQLPEADRLERFYALWTLKESYIKARGMGLAIPLDEFRFELDGPAARIVIEPSLGDRADTWQFVQRCPSPAHRLALAIRKGSDADWEVVERTVVPLAD